MFIKQGIQGMILFIVELFVNVSVFVLNHHQGNVNMWCIFGIIFNLKMKRKNVKTLIIVLM